MTPHLLAALRCIAELDPCLPLAVAIQIAQAALEKCDDV